MSLRDGLVQLLIFFTIDIVSGNLLLRIRQKEWNWGFGRPVNGFCCRNNFFKL